MLRQLTVFIFLLNAGLLFFAGLNAAAILLLLSAVIVFFSHKEYSHVTNKELSYLAGRLSQIIPLVLAFFIIVCGVSPLDIKQTIPFFVATCLAIIPTLALFAIGQPGAKAGTPLQQFRDTRILRCLLGAMGGQAFLILLGLIGVLAYHLLPAITITQIIAIQLALVLPLSTLRTDKNPHKLLKATDHNFRLHTIGKRAFESYLGYGFLAAALSYINYRMVFYRHNLSPYYLDSSLPLYKQATSLTMLTFVLCVFVGIIFERVDRRDYFINEHTLDNTKLLKSFGISIAFLAVIIYVPHVRNTFDCAPLNIIDWLSAAGLATVYGVFRMTKRHVRKHSRRAVIKLHRQLNS